MNDESKVAARSSPVNVLAFIDELNADPSLLRTWLDEFSGGDPITLVIHPSDWIPEDVAEVASRIVSEAGIADGPGSAVLQALTGPLDAHDHARLLENCVAVYGRIAAPTPFAELPIVGPEQLSALRRYLPGPQPSALKQESNLITATVNGSWTVAFRDTAVDRSVMDQIFAQESYSLKRLYNWPGIEHLANLPGGNGAPLIVDAGANFGASCVYFAARYPQARIIAIEPEPGNFGVLQRNAAQIAHARSIQAALAANPGVIQLTDPGIGAWGFRAGTSVGEGPVIGEVAAVTIQEILSAEAATTPFLLKIDIEGAEGDVFSEHHEELNRFPLVIVELHDWMIPEKETSRPFLRWHLEHNRDLMSIGENLFSISPDLRRARLD